MPKVLLQGPVEEQAAHIYDLALEAMEEGRYTAAYRYYQEIERAVPGFRDVPQRLEQARYAKSEQRFLLWGSLLGAMAGIILVRLLGAPSEWWFLGAGIVGLLAGFLFSQPLFRLTHRPPGAASSE
jgi:hypothetical protein